MSIDNFDRCIFGHEFAIILSSELVTLCPHLIFCSNEKGHLSKVHINIEMGNLHMRLSRSPDVKYFVYSNMFPKS